MLKRSIVFGTLVGLGLSLGIVLSGGAIAAPHNMNSQPPPTEFRRIDQPLINKIAVTLGGMGLIGLDLWWFLLSKPKSQRVE
jgi:plastocyanin domain-containing protein